MTAAYLSTVLPNRSFNQRNIIPIEKVIIWAHNHTTSVKAIKLAMAVIGMSLMAYSFYITAPFIYKFTAAISGTAVSAISVMAYRVLDIIAPPKHEMSTHTIKPNKTENAEIYYKNDVPILKIKTDDPYKAGYAHGYILGEYINHLKSKWTLAMQKLPPLMPFIHTTPIVEKLPNVLREVKKQIPEKYLTELQGLVDGFNKWIDESYSSYNPLRPKQLILEEAILFHLEPDVPHFKHLRAEYETNCLSKSSAACTTVIDKDDKEGITFGRNMDWPTLGVAGKQSLVILKKSPITGKKTAEVGIPGLISTLTGMNEHGLSVCMNISYGNTTVIEGIPNSFVVRYILETCKSVQEVERKLNEIKSLGPFHLIAADTNEAKAFHIKQASEIKVSFLEKDKPLIVGNLSLDPEITDNVNFSKERENNIQDLLKDAYNKIVIAPSELIKNQIIKAAMKLPFVNNILTSHTIIMQPGSKRIEVAFDNAYSAKNNLHMLEKKDLF